jgi:prephenate dehydratase
MIRQLEDEDNSAAIEELPPHCHFLKVLGSYPNARSEAKSGGKS